jgi:hypothetical protein
VPDRELPNGGEISDAAIAVKMLLRMLVDNRDNPERARKLRDAMGPEIERIFGGATFVPDDPADGPA